MTLRRDAAAIYDAAVAGVEPSRAVARALSGIPLPDLVSLVAIGKASAAMSRAAVDHLHQSGRSVRTGVMITPDQGDSPERSIIRVTGDHPLTGAGSAAAARAVVAWSTGVRPGETVWAFVSGGASSLVGSPVEPITPADYGLLQRNLFGAGLPIDQLNRIRKRVALLGAGRLAQRLAVAGALEVFLLSDVPSNEPADIGSGPFEPDPTTAGVVRRLLVDSIGASRIPLSVDGYLAQVQRGERPETPKPGDPAFARRRNHLVGSNRIAVDHAAAKARDLGYDVIVRADFLAGDAAAAGRRFAEAILTAPTDGRARVWLAGGETTVVLADGAGRGGRCQELALAAAQRLAGTPIVLLAAGTDGRDGPTDAAGATVDGTTWARIQARGIDPARSLEVHDAYAALASVDGLIRTGPTGTNVMDVVIALRPADRR